MDNETAYGELGPTRASTSCGRESPRNVPPAIKRLIGELGLRYRPSGQADLEAHAASLALLARDLADVPPHFLERAIRDWVPRSHFMPKASELVELARKFQDEAGGKRDPASVDRLHKLAASLNSSRFAAGYGWHYSVKVGEDGLHFLDRTDH